MNRTCVQLKALDEPRPIRGLVYQSDGAPSKSRILVHPLPRWLRRIEITIGTALASAERRQRLEPVSLRCPARSGWPLCHYQFRHAHRFPRGGGYAQPAFHPSRKMQPCRPRESDRLQLGSQPNPNVRLGNVATSRRGRSGVIAGLDIKELVELALLLIAVGALSGFLAGVFDIGGGAILVPCFTNASASPACRLRCACRSASAPRSR